MVSDGADAQKLCADANFSRANAFMNAWDSETVSSFYEKQTLGFLTNINGKTEVHPTRVALAFRKLVDEDGCNPQDPSTLRKARELSPNFVNTRIPFETLIWLAFTMMLSELGKTKELNDLLDYADSRLDPTWERGGLYYPRNDGLMDEEYNLIHMEPHSGNSGIGYSRLNVPNGQRAMWEQPWTRELLVKRPWVDGAGFADDVDFLRGVWDAERHAMIVTLRKWIGAEAGQVRLSFNNLPAGLWAVYVNGKLKETKTSPESGVIDISEHVGESEVDIVVVRV